MTNIVLSGYYGSGNIGDEAVLAGILAGLREAGLSARVTVISADPERTIREHAGVQAIPRMAPCAITRALLRADLFLSGGGSLFQDVTSARSPYYYLTVLRLAQILRRKTMIYAQGVGPLQRPAIRAAIAKAFNRASAITVRDQDSSALLREIGVTREAQVCADPSFLVEPDLDAADRIISDAGLTGRDIVGIALRPWPGHDEWLADAARDITALCAEIGAQPAFIPMQEPDDAVFGDASATLRHGGDPRVAKGLIARCRMIVGMRLHALIFAAAAGVPFVPIAYDPKVSSFAADAGASRVELGDSTALAGTIRTTWQDREALARKLASRSAEFRESAMLPARIAANLLT